MSAALLRPAGGIPKALLPVARALLIAARALLPALGALILSHNAPAAPLVPRTLSKTPAAPAAQKVPADTLGLARKAEEYLSAIDALPLGQACAEVNLMIGAVQDTVLRSDVAVRAYRHFRQSHLMGSENVAVHIYDRWFASFEAVFPSIEELDEAEMYAWVNRRSLIGAQAPRISLITSQGDTLTIPTIPRSKCKKRLTVLYFYSTLCPKCLYNSLKLKELKFPKGIKADIVTVYTGEDDQAWAAYTARELDIRPASRKIKVLHLKGPSDGDYPLAYGVVQTPRLFLISEDGIIIGRGLDADALQQLLIQN